VEAGFDGVQIHCAHGYLGSQFISPYTNTRDDQWGGSLENRMRFPLEVYSRMRKTVGDTYPLLIKLNSEDFISGGLTIEQSVQIAQALSDKGIDAIEISGGMAETVSEFIKPNILEERDEAYFLTNARRFKEVIDVPLILVGGLRSFGLMEKLVERGEAEMVALSRPFIREPDLVNRWKQGDREKADCISCCGCIKFRDEPVRCILID
jgi:2,4-dienoyl-CoA reductase-like NADH-dependent reductase (Old Yellow Enzyme family)